MTLWLPTPSAASMCRVIPGDYISTEVHGPHSLGLCSNQGPALPHGTCMHMSTGPHAYKYLTKGGREEGGKGDLAERKTSPRAAGTCLSHNLVCSHKESLRLAGYFICVYLSVFLSCSIFAYVCFSAVTCSWLEPVVQRQTQPASFS